ncbi:MAG: insulinase family protein [Pedobacter sp.]|nr:MAG: insulinase family protein [Pedobacter sp.]
MKTLTKITTLLITFLSLNVAMAQQNMKVPVKFKLKNGVTLIVAPNQGMGKIYSRLTVENDEINANTEESTFLNNLLQQKADTFNKIAYPLNGEVSPVSLQVAEANTATRTNDFEEALTFAVNAMFNPNITQDAVDNAAIKNLNVEQLKSYHKNTVKQSDTFLTIAGDISVADAKMMVNKIFGNWKEIALAK